MTQLERGVINSVFGEPQLWCDITGFYNIRHVMFTVFINTIGGIVRGKVIMKMWVLNRYFLLCACDST